MSRWARLLPPRARAWWAPDPGVTSLKRARELRPVFDTVDFLLDIHSMQHESSPLMLAGGLAKGRDFADLARQRFAADPMPGAELAAFVAGRFNVPEQLVERLRAATAQP